MPIHINMVVYDMTIGQDPLVEHTVTAIGYAPNGTIASLQLDHSYCISPSCVLTF